jgi:hypothetical protein
MYVARSLHGRVARTMRPHLRTNTTSSLLVDLDVGNRDILVL